MKVIGYYCNNKGLLVNSEGEHTDISPYLDFILRDSTHPNEKEQTIQIFYNINYNVANILKTIGITKEQGAKLNSTEELLIPPYKLKYVPNKFFSIKKGSYFCNVSDASQYGNLRLEDDEPLDTCIMRANKAAQIGQQVLEGMNSIGLYPTSITSPIRAFEREKLAKLDLPVLEDIPIDVLEYADECCDASWLEGYRVGSYDKVFDYDLISAYPSQTSQLVDIRCGTWQRVESFEPHGLYGYYLCRLEIDSSAEFSPIMYVIKNNNNNYNKNFTPTGSWYRVLTKKQIEFIYHWNLGKVEIIDGWTWIKNKGTKDIYPFKETMEWLFTEKNNNIKAGNGQRKENIKRIMSGIYGKFREIRNSRNPETGKYEKIYGQYANTVYAAEIETNTKLEVADFVLRNSLTPIHIAVDGVVVKENVKPDQLSDNLGGWRLNNEDKCISISTGVIAIKGKFDDNPEEKKDFSLDYDWLLNAIKDNPDSKVYVMRKKTPVTLAMASKDGGLKWSELGQLQPTSRSINIGYEEKRLYKQRPECGKDVLNCDLKSYPLDVTLLERLNNKD